MTTPVTIADHGEKLLLYVRIAYRGYITTYTEISHKPTGGYTYLVSLCWPKYCKKERNLGTGTAYKIRKFQFTQSPFVEQIADKEISTPSH